MSNIIKKCECGGTDFFINEAITWKAELTSDGELTTYKNKADEIENINCSKCGAIYNEDSFSQINFN